MGKPVGEGDADYGEHEADHQDLGRNNRNINKDGAVGTYQEGPGYLGFKLGPLHHLESTSHQQ